jgi:hypothetical protein
VALEILNPQSPRWRAFTSGVYHWILVKEHPLEWRCEGEDSPRRYKAVVAVASEMGGVDITGTIAALDGLGLMCPCDCGVADAFVQGVRSPGRMP